MPFLGHNNLSILKICICSDVWISVERWGISSSSSCPWSVHSWAKNLRSKPARTKWVVWWFNMSICYALILWNIWRFELVGQNILHVRTRLLTTLCRFTFLGAVLFYSISGAVIKKELSNFRESRSREQLLKSDVDPSSIASRIWNKNTGITWKCYW